MKKFYSILMASAVALSASALSIETTEFGAVQDVRSLEGVAPAKSLLGKIHKLPASGVLPAIDLSGKKIVKFDQTVNPKSRVLGGFEGNVADYSMMIFVNYFEEEQMASSGFKIKITKEATADTDAEVEVSGFLPSDVSGVKPVKGTMSPNGEITLPFGQVLMEQKSGNTTRQYKFESPLTKPEEILYYTYDSNNDQFVSSTPVGVAVYDNGQLAGFYGIWMDSFFAVPNGAFVFTAQQQGQQAQQLGMDILALVEHNADANVDICYIFGLNLVGDSFVASFEVGEGSMYAFNSKCFPSPDFGDANQSIYFNDFMLASYDETLKANVFPVVATYEPDMGKNSETQEQVYDVYSIPMFEFIDPYYNIDLFYTMGYATGDAYIFVNKGVVSGVEDVVAAPAKGNARYYNIQGMEIKNPTKGQLLIEKAGDASRKIIF